MVRHCLRCLIGKSWLSLSKNNNFVLPSTIHMYEPVPGFFTELATYWDKYKEELGYDATLYNYGLGKNNRYSVLILILILEKRLIDYQKERKFQKMSLQELTYYCTQAQI